MGPLPKKRISRTRQARKRARYLKVKLPHMVVCASCNTLRISHTVCANCGTYNDTQVVSTNSEE